MSAQPYPLSPLQQGMLYHALSEPCSGVDIEQLVMTFHEPIDIEKMIVAWNAVIARHGILRTAFRWDGAEPLQQVEPMVALPFSRDESLPADDAAFQRWLQADRERGFQMDRAPLMRLTHFTGNREETRIVWTFHHALLDGRSFPIVLDEVLAFYADPLGAAPSLPRPYRDFIEWQVGRSTHASADFWRDKLRSFHSPTPLPVQGLDGVAEKRTQAEAEIILNPAQTTVLASFAAAESVTLNTLVQTAWAILLSRYSGEEDVCFGATRACRHSTIPGAEDAVGLFINTVPVRAEVSATKTIAALVRELRQLWIDIRPHEHTPLSRIQSYSEVPPGQPLFNTLVVFENYDLRAKFESRTVGQRVSVRLHEQTNFPVCLAAYAGDNLRLVAEYDRSKLDDATIGRMLGHLRNILTALPLSKNVADVPLVDFTEHESLISRPAQTAADDPRNSQTLHALFSQRAELHPDAIALTQGAERMTYRELDERANAVAAHLAANGVAPGSIVGLCMERCPSLVVALLGILKAGAAYLPIDLAYPPERLEFMLADAAAPVLLTQRHLAVRLPAKHKAALVAFEDIAPTAPRISQNGAPSDLCYVLYTSGSTGKPKGCCISHHNVVRLFTATEHWFDFSREDVWTLFHSTAFDFSVWEIWGALLHGGKLVVVPFETSRSPEQFHQLLVRERVTFLNQTPAAFRQLIAADAASPRSRELALRTVVFGGEALEMQSLRPWFERHGDRKPQLVNMYGITETTVHVTYRPLSASDLQRGSVIGEPIPDLSITIFDPQLRPVPIGVPGELFVGGKGLAREYLGRPELTAQRFIENPFVPGTRLYRTGDLARWLPNRDIEYLGRIDQQVKIRGFRIELGEIESHLLTHPGIREAAVLARDSISGKQLVAWFVPEGTAPTAAELRTHLRAFVPDYMVPSAFVPVERMPLTNNGKLDHRALPAPAADRREASAGYTAPSSDAERALAEIWQRLLKIERVGVHDNFFELGGDSILSILVVTQARQRGLSITPKQVFDHPTIAALASCAPSEFIPLRDFPAVGEVPLTPIQKWFFAHRFAEQHHWNQSFAFRLTKPVSAARLSNAVAAVAAHHAVFKLRFNNAGRQYFADSPGVDFVENCPPDALQSSLSLGGPLARFSLLGGDTLAVAIHHLIVDGVSWRILLDDLDRAIAGAPLLPATNGFHTWAAQLQESAIGAASERDYWREIMDADSVQIPRDYPAGENLESSSDTVIVRLSADESAQLLSRLPVGVRTLDVLVASLAEALCAWAGSDALTIETEGHGREEGALKQFAQLAGTPDLSRTVGWFTCIHPIRLQTAGTAAATLFTNIRNLRHVPSNGFGYSLLRHIAADGESLQSSAEVLFNYLGQFDHTVEGLEHFAFSDTPTGPWHSPAAQRTHLLEINALILNGCLEARFGFSTAIHSRAAIETLAASFLESARKMMSVKFPLSRLPQETEQALAAQHPALEDIYPLSPMQRLFLAVEYAQPSSGNDQWHCKLRGSISPGDLLEAWRVVAHRHPALRSGYIADSAEPHQFVVSDAPPEMHFEDIAHLPADAATKHVAAFLTADAVRPFDLTKPPLTRFALFRTAAQESRFVWTHHHLEIDGWSWPLVFEKLSLALEQKLAAMPPVPPYRAFILWLEMLDQRPAHAFWTSQLAGFRKPTPLPLSREAGPEVSCSIHLNAEIAALLNSAARSLRVTINALVQSVWAALLARHAAHDDIVFGAAFSGRPAEMPGADRIVGHFVNNLPVRLRIEAGSTLTTAALAIHQQLSQITAHQNTSLADIQSWCELPWNARLFETLVVFQNYIIDGVGQRLGHLELSDLHAPVRTNYPFTLIVNPGEPFRLTLVTNQGVTSRASVSELLEQFAALLSSALAAPESPLVQLSTALPLLRRESSVPSPVMRPLTQPGSSLEKTIAGIWAEAFARPVSVTENFFDLGGHSLLMVRVHARLVAETGRQIPIVTMFQHPTIRGLAAFLDGKSTQPDIANAAQDRAAKARAALTRKPAIRKVGE